MQNFWSFYHLSSIYLARSNNTLFMTGTQGNDVNSYRNYLYVLPGDGSCASAGCATKVITLPAVYQPTSGNEPQRIVTVTALAAGYLPAFGEPVVAVGLSDGGVRIYEVTRLGVGLRATFTGMATGDGSQTPVTALAFNPSGSLLTVGVISWSDRGFFVHLDPSGGITGWQSSLLGAGRGQVEPLPMSAAVGQGPNGEPVAALGLDAGGSLQLFDNPTASTGEISPTSTSPANAPNAIVAINPIPRVDGTAPITDYAVSYQPGSDIGSGPGGLLRWDGTSSAPANLPLSPGSNLAPDRESFRSWYPGIKEGRLQFTNSSSEPVTVTLHARPQPAYGCWYAPAWADAAAFPSQPITVAAGQTSAIYAMGAFTAGAQGGCAAADVTGAWRGYLVVTPVSHPADARVLDLRLNRDMTVTLDPKDQAGGSTSVTITHQHPVNQPKVELGGAFGLWNVNVDTPAAPTPQAAPAVTPFRLTTPQAGRADVYRFDVAATTWSVPGADVQNAPSQVEAVIPPLTVQGSVDGTNWVTLGLLQPPSAPSSESGTVTVGSASFFWENPPAAPTYRQIHVLAGSLVSPAVVLAGLPVPNASASRISQITLTKGLSNTATPEPNGLDQAAVEVQISAGSVVLPGTDPTYGSVYYRDESDNLITNLYQPGGYASFVGVQPLPGAYPNTTLSALPAGSVAGYLSTTSLSLHSVQGFVGISNVRGSQPLNVQAAALNIQPAPSQSGGFVLTGCADFSNSAVCQVAALPALYQAGSPATGPLTGVLLVTQGQNAVADLPLQWPANLGAQNLATTGLNTSAATITLNDPTDFLPGDHVDVTLVSHGQVVAATVPVSTG